MASQIDLVALEASFVPASFTVVRLEGEERLSRPFVYTLTLSSGENQIDPTTALDQPVTITVGADAEGGQARIINGIVCAIDQRPSNKSGIWQCTLSVVPKLWFLKQTRASRFYHNLAATDILQTVLGKFSVTPTLRVQGSYSPVDYVVQYNESYFDFFQRVVEENGLFYFFEHSGSDCTLVIADYNQAFNAATTDVVQFVGRTHDASGFDRWRRQDQTGLGGLRIDDYNPTTVSLAPGAITATQNATGGTSGNSQRTSFTWPARTADAGGATTKSDNRLTANEAVTEIYSGDGRVAQLYAGGKFTLADPISGADTDYVVLSLRLVIADQAARGSATSGGGTAHTHCTAFPASAPWREPLTVARPVMAGLFSAKVIGTSGEEIYTDDFGRIQVQFPWDTEGDITAGSTAWVRVVQPWAGANWGAQFIPRVGMEVAVAFLEGDVDRPVVVGSLYNFDNTPTFAPADKNKSGWRTRSTTGGGTSNFSEFSFDDTMGSEVVYLHAEKDHTVEVENDESLTVQGKQTETITGNRSVTISQGNDSLTVSSGSLTIETSASSVSITAATSITLQVGGNSIKIDTSGITLTALKVTIDAQTTLQASGATVQVSGQGEVQVSAGGSVMVSGAAVMIN
jgi:type VI secretion system secreted protein VgrG